MPGRQPSQTRNLDIYGSPPLPWARAHDLLETGPHGPLAGFFLATADSDGRPHVAGVGVIWQHFMHPVHAQRFAPIGFVSHLGFLDLLFNCGPASRDILFERSHPARLEAA